ncbi:MAG: radical SAM protein [Myxococcales bacterium]|nr:radical SAM protein [Myxococcales bacterium]
MSHDPASPRPPRASLPVVDRAVRDKSDARPLIERLAARAKPAALFEPTEHGHVRCLACAHGCVIQEGREGACAVRFVREGKLYAPHGYVARRLARNVETNTLYHFRAGERSMIMGMYGCDLRCPYCHNWRLSQALREDSEHTADEEPLECTAEALVDHAIEQGCTVMAAAYNEPMIAAEWVRDVFAEAKRRGLATAVISDANTTREALSFIRPVCDAYRVDLKAADNERYRALGGRSGPVFDAIAIAKELGFWVEVVTMVVPGFNDELRSLRTIADAIARVSKEIPWHLNAFVPRYKLEHVPRMEVNSLASAVGMGYAKGLAFVYASNARGGYSELSHTRCPACHEVLIERDDYRVTASHLKNGACFKCGANIPGVWGERAASAANAEGEAELP